MTDNRYKSDCVLLLSYKKGVRFVFVRFFFQNVANVK